MFPTYLLTTLVFFHSFLLFIFPVWSPLLFQLHPSSSPISIINVALNFPNASYGPTPSSLLFKIQVPSLSSQPVFLTFPNPSSIFLQPSCLPYFSKSIFHLSPAILSSLLFQIHPPSSSSLLVSCSPFLLPPPPLFFSPGFFTLFLPSEMFCS